MLVRAISDTLLSRPAIVGAFGSPFSRLHISIGQTYEVHALAVFEGHVVFQVVDDTGGPTWRPSFLFEVIDPAIPADWIGNTFAGEPQLIIGPNFVAESVAAYEAMVQLEPEPTEAFWRRLVSTEARGKDEN
jgi:hypothetical protein